MTSRNWLIVVSAMGLLAVGLPGSNELALTNCVMAAPPAAGFGTTGAPANEVTEFKGTLKGVRGMFVTVTRDDGTDVMVQFPDNPASLVFVAKALPAYLRPGMSVRFSTTLGPAGTPIAPIQELEIFAPINTRALPGHSKTLYEPGVHPADHKPRPKNTPLTGKVNVVGNLMMLNAQGGLAMRAGTIPVQTMVAPNFILEIRANNLSLAQPGDPVSVAGFYQPPDDTKVKADRMTITTDRVYGEAPPPKTRRSRRDSKKDAEVPPVDEGKKDGDEANGAAKGEGDANTGDEGKAAAEGEGAQAAE